MYDIAVSGGGYVGLTCAVHFVNAGKNVVIYDPDQSVVNAINEGKPKAGEFLNYLGAQELPIATTDFRDTVRGTPVHIIAVPTERGGIPDDQIVLDALHRIWLQTAPGTLIIVESTLIPGTIDKFFFARQEDKQLAGSQKFLAVCPRRDWFCDKDKNLHTLPRVVGGYTEACTAKAIEVLSQVSPHILPTTYRTAEITKSLENALLHVPLMMIHQLAASRPDLDVAEAVRLASTHWRLMPLHLNFGSGGRCVPLGTQYLAQAAGEPFKIGSDVVSFEKEIRTIAGDAAIELTKKPPALVSALVLGIAYRPEFRDAGLSPGLAVARRIVERGGVVEVHDPMWTNEELAALTGIGVAKTLTETRNYDVILVATPHKVYRNLPDTMELRSGQVILDAQGSWAGYSAKFKAAGVKYRQVGSPGWRG